MINTILIAIRMDLPVAVIGYWFLTTNRPGGHRSCYHATNAKRFEIKLPVMNRGEYSQVILQDSQLDSGFDFEELALHFSRSALVLIYSSIADKKLVRNYLMKL
jgi:hypothetical protein